jgi:hypothetical protein
MRYFITGLAAEFWKLQGGNVLHLVAVARRRTSVGVDCDPWGQSAPSFFSLEPMDITARVFELTDLPIDIVCQSINDVGMNGCLLEIAGCLYEGISPIKPDCPIAGDQKHLVKLFSSNQLFLGAFQSPRRDTLLHAKSDFSQLLGLARAASLEQPEAKLR